jgi:hypothetical protein
VIFEYINLSTDKIYKDKHLKKCVSFVRKTNCIKKGTGFKSTFKKYQGYSFCYASYAISSKIGVTRVASELVKAAFINRRATDTGCLRLE